MQVLTQLRYTGIFGLCKLRQAGYSERPTLEEFFLRFRVLSRPWPRDVERLVQDLSSGPKPILKPNMWVKGRTKLMLKHEQARRPAAPSTSPSRRHAATPSRTAAPSRHAITPRHPTSPRRPTALVGASDG